MPPKEMTPRREAPPMKPESSLSRRYLRVLEKWIPIGLHYFKDWPDRPNAGHFLGGCHWYGIETIAGAVTFAAAASAPDYDPAAGGCSRDALQQIALKALRYLCFTHDTGPEDCVRPATGLGRPENCGTKWGERGKGFFRESQCGLTVADMALVALLLGDLVDDETWAMLAAVHRDYGRRFGTMAPKSGVYTNTQMEENGWTACGLASVECLLSEAAEAGTWAHAARRWMFSTATTQQDTKNRARFDGERTTAQLTGEIFTALPDYMAENHGMVHPGYTASAVSFAGHLGVIYAAFGQPLPPHALFNRSEVYAQLKMQTDSTGSMHPVQGMDWPYLFTDPGTGTHGAAAALLKDPDAANLERRALKTLEERQVSNGGRMYDPEVAEKAHDIQDPMIIRESVIQGPALTYLLHRFCGDGPKPTPDTQMERRLRGVRVYPHAGFVFHRHRRGQTAFSWRNCIMALPFNRDGIQTVAPASNTLLASFQVRNRPDSHQLRSLKVDEHRDGFAAAMVVDRAQGALRQEVLYAGLPGGASVCWERLTANESLTVERLEQGFLRIINERFSAMARNCRGYRRFYTPEGEETFHGGISTDPDSDVVRTYDHPAWVNVDERLAILFTGPGSTVYHNRHYFKPWWAVADDLTLSRLDRPFRAASGRRIAEFTALIAPDVSHRKTPDLQFVRLSGTAGAVGAIAEGHLVAADFSGRSRTIRLSCKRGALEAVPVCAGTVSLSDDKVTYHLGVCPNQAVLRQALCTVRVTGTVTLVASDAGDIVARNEGRKAASVSVGKAGRTVRLKAGQTAVLNG